MQTHPWSPAKTNIAIVRSPAKAVGGATIRVSRTPAPPRVAGLADQRTTTDSGSALGHPAQNLGSEAAQQATPAGKRAVRAAISQLREVSQAPPQSRIPAYSPSPPDAGAQPMRERSVRGPGHRPLAGAELARRGRQLDSKQASPGQRLPHLRAAMMETSVRTNALLLETGGSAGSGLSMHGSRVAMRSIGEAQRAASTERSIHSMASSRGAQGESCHVLNSFVRRHGTPTAYSGGFLHMPDLQEVPRHLHSGRTLSWFNKRLLTLTASKACVRRPSSSGMRLFRGPLACAGNRGQNVSALERQVLQQYLSARQLRDRAAAQRGNLSVTSRYGSARPDSRAGAVLVRRQWSATCPAHLLL